MLSAVRVLSPGAGLFVCVALGCGGAGGESGETGGAGSTSTGTELPTTSVGASSGGTSGSEGTSSAAGTSEGSSTGPGVGETGSSSGESSSGESSGEGTSSGGVEEEAAWLRSFGAPTLQRPGGVGFTPNGELWVAGDVFGGMDLGLGPLAGEGSGIYLARYAVDGETLHAQASFAMNGEATLTTVGGLAVDGAGAVIVTGWLEGSHAIGGALLVADELDVFVGKWDAAGAPVWGKKFGEVDWQVGYSLAVAADDSIWVAGAALAPFHAGDIELTGAASTGMFLLRLSAEGAPEVGRWWGEMGDQEARSVAVCEDGSVALAGFFSAPLTFGAAQVDTNGQKDMFVALVDAAGEPLWIRGLGGAKSDSASHVACGQDVLFAGAVTGAATIGSLELTPAGDADAVIGRLDVSDGTLTWAAGLAGAAEQSPAGVGIGADGAAWIVVTSEGTTKLGDTTVEGAGERDVVLARYARDAASPAAVVRLGDAARETAGALTMHASGAAALAVSHAGALEWDGLPAVAATGDEDLAVVRWVPTGP